MPRVDWKVGTSSIRASRAISQRGAMLWWNWDQVGSATHSRIVALLGEAVRFVGGEEIDALDRFGRVRAVAEGRRSGIRQLKIGNMSEGEGSSCLRDLEFLSYT